MTREKSTFAAEMRRKALEARERLAEKLAEKETEENQARIDKKFDEVMGLALAKLEGEVDRGETTAWYLWTDDEWETEELFNVLTKKVIEELKTYGLKAEVEGDFGFLVHIRIDC